MVVKLSHSETRVIGDFSETVRTLSYIPQNGPTVQLQTTVGPQPKVSPRRLSEKVSESVCSDLWWEVNGTDHTHKHTTPGVDCSLPVPPGADMCQESEHGCEHICESSPGSFHCLCLPGYTLNADGKTCAGEWLVGWVSVLDCGDRDDGPPVFQSNLFSGKECNCSLSRGGDSIHVLDLSKRTDTLHK